MKYSITIYEIYELVDWSDNPNYTQLLQTVEIVQMFYKNPDQFPKSTRKKIDRWLKYNSLTKFQVEIQRLEKHNLHLDNFSIEH